MSRSHMPFANFRRGVAVALVRSHRVSRTDAVKLVKRWHEVILSRWMAGQDVAHVAKHVYKYETQGVVCPCHERRDCPSRRYGRDASDPKAGEVYQSKTGNRWVVTGRTPKGHVLVKRTAPKYNGELQWTPAMLAKLQQVRGAEARAVQQVFTSKTLDEKFPWLFQRIMGRPRTSEEYVQTPLFRDPNRRYYVYVIETLKKGKRAFYVGQTGKKPEQRFKEHKAGRHYAYAKGAKLLRKDLTKHVPPLYTRKQAERAERIIARTLRKRGLSVTGGH